MAQVNVGPVDLFSGTEQTVLQVQGREIAVFQVDETLVAYENVCPHMGGPVCQGKIFARVEEVIEADRTSSGMRFSRSNNNIVCPWHGYEYDLRTGEHPGSPRFKLKSVRLQVISGEVFLDLPEKSLTPQEADNPLEAKL